MLFLDVLDITEEDAFSCPHLLRYRVSNKKEDDYYSSYSDSMEETSDRLRRLVHPFILRRLKKDVLKELPDKIKRSFPSIWKENRKNSMTLTPSG